METQTQIFSDNGEREVRGRELAKRGGIRSIGSRWTVPSQASSGSYLVDLVDATCNCPDFELRHLKCKHQHAVEFFVIYQENADGTVTETMAVRRTYRQNWPAYNAAQVAEQEHVEKLLRALCDGIQEPPRGKGRPRIPLRDLVYAAVLKVYGGMSGRRAQTDVRRCRAAGLIERAPSYNSIFRAFENPALTPILTTLIEKSALPLKDFEFQFAPDSTGFGTTTYERRQGLLEQGQRAENRRQ